MGAELPVCQALLHGPRHSFLIFTTTASPDAPTLQMGRPRHTVTGYKSHSKRGERSRIQTQISGPERL